MASGLPIILGYRLRTHIRVPDGETQKKKEGGFFFSSCEYTKALLFLSSKGKDCQRKLSAAVFEQFKVNIEANEPEQYTRNFRKGL